jgi:DNA-binding CsgD family transcriptional regulator/PAS domain-containing protein
LDTRAQTELDLVGAIYDAVIDPERWDDTVERIRRHLGFYMSILSVIAVPSGRQVVSARGNVSRAFAESLPSYSNEATALWGGLQRLAMLPREEPLIHTQANAAYPWLGNSYYEEWAKPQGLVDQVVLILESNPRLIANIGFGVHETMPPISAEQMDSLRVLAPHLRRAAIISGLLVGRTEAAASFEATLSALGSAVVLVDEQMHIIYANERADGMLRDGDPLLRLDGRLELPRELVRGQLQAAVTAAALDASGLTRGSGIPVRRRDGSGMIVHVLPLKRRRLRMGVSAVGARGGAVAAIFVAEPQAELNLPIEAMQLLYGLRPAESRVLELIVEGLSAAKIAQALGIASSTVKTHTLRLFDKLDVHSRAELLRFVRGMSLG